MSQRAYLMLEDIEVLVKIGKSADPRIRRGGLATGNSRKITVLASTDQVSEKELHERFEDKNIVEGGGKEWFKMRISEVLALAKEMEENDGIEAVTDEKIPQEVHKVFPESPLTRKEWSSWFVETYLSGGLRYSELTRRLILSNVVSEFKKPYIEKKCEEKEREVVNVTTLSQELFDFCAKLKTLIPGASLRKLKSDFSNQSTCESILRAIIIKEEMPTSRVFSEIPVKNSIKEFFEDLRRGGSIDTTDLRNYDKNTLVVVKKKFYELYSNWCIDSESQDIGDSLFGRRLKGMGIESKTAHSGSRLYLIPKEYVFKQ